MYLGDHRWLVSPPNQYLVTDGVYRRQTAALQTADCLWGLCLLHSPSAANLRGKRVCSLPRRTLSSSNWPIMSHLAPHPEPAHPTARASPWKHTQTRYEWWSLTGPIGGRKGAEQVSPWWSGDRGILQRAAVAIETQNACHPMLSRIEMEEDSARELKSANADHWLVSQWVYWLKINLH